MTAKIYDTTITTGDDDSTVHLLISDVPDEEGPWTFRLQLYATLPNYVDPLLLHYQREAILMVREQLGELSDSLIQKLSAHYPARPTVKH